MLQDSDQSDQMHLVDKYCVFSCIVPIPFTGFFVWLVRLLTNLLIYSNCRTLTFVVLHIQCRSVAGRRVAVPAIDRAYDELKPTTRLDVLQRLVEASL